MSLQRSLASSTPAMTGTFKAPKFHSRTGAVNHPGFPPLLAEMLTKAFGCKASPDYLVFQSSPIPHLHRFDARVCISLAADGQPLVFQGRAMPTSDLAIQAAAVEAMLHLRTRYPHMAARRDFCFYPIVTEVGMQPSPAIQGDDPAIARLVQYITAQGMMISQMLAEFRTLDNDAVRVVKEAYREARKFASQVICPTPSEPVLSSQPVLWPRPNIVTLDKALLRIHQQHLLGSISATPPAAEPQPIVLSDDEDGDWLSLRPPGEPQQGKSSA